MGDELWIHRAVRTWLAGLLKSEPGLARLVGEAVLALLEGGEILGPPLVVPLRPVLWTGDAPWTGWSRPQDAWLRARRTLADVATSRKRVELQVRQLERLDEADKMGSREELLAELRSELARLVADEERLVSRVGELERLTTPEERRQAMAGQLTGQDLTIGAMVLRPGAPNYVRAGLLVVTPAPGTLVLLAPVADLGAPANQHQAEISARLAESPGATAFSKYDAKAFLDEFFAGKQVEAGIGAAALLARHRVHTLAEVRQRMELTQAQVAQRMDVRQERVSAIERAGPGAIEVRTLAAYIAALGGTLEFAARIDNEAIILSDHP